MHSGFPMAQNLRRRLPKEDELYVYDTNLAATTKFEGEALTEHGVKSVHVADGPRTVAENSVSVLFFNDADQVFVMILFYL